MLASLTIKNVVLIEHLKIDFREGLCALTGETGAGKSILLDSLGLSLGARSDFGLVRQGEEQANVSAEFEIDNTHSVHAFIKDQSLETDTTLILRRSISNDGKSKAYINDQPVSAKLLKSVGEMLVEIHGQFDTQILLNAQNHIHLLDEYAEHEGLLKSLKTIWKQWKDAEENLESERRKIEQARNDEEYYRASLEDLDALAPQKGEEENLSKLRDRLMGREKIIESINAAEEGIQEIENASSSVWKSLNRLGDDGKKPIEAMERVNAEIEEVKSALHNLLDDLDSSEHSLQEIDDRLFNLKAQARKHGCTIDQLSEKRDEIAQALDAIESQDGYLAKLLQQVDAYKKDYQVQAEKLSKKRQEAAKKLAKLVMKELPPLKLEKARFDISVEELEEGDWNSRGWNKVEFLVATNPGAQAGALNKVASGGEMARLMLAIKVVLAEIGTAGSLVFDEVDSGIGGATAAAVGERLARLADKRQILVVTHSPQVAAIAQNHWIVTKTGQKTVTTNIMPLYSPPERQEEIARMISGAEVTDEARAAAGKLLEASVA